LNSPEEDWRVFLDVFTLGEGVDFELPETDPESQG
jgi:hypothetical protein